MAEVNGRTYAPVPGKIPGTALNLSGVEFVAAPFNLDGIQEVMPLLEKFKATPDAAGTIRAVAPILLLSLNRNDPDLTLEQLLPLLDLGNAIPSLFAVCKVSGIEFTKPGESTPASP